MANISNLSDLDERILSLADHASPEEISRELGGVVSPARIAARVKNILGSRDWLSLAEQEQVVLHKMRQLLERVEGQFFDLDNASVQLRILKELGSRLDHRRSAITVDLNTYNENVGRKLGQVVDLALTYMKGALRDEVDPDRWNTLMQEALLQARQEIERDQASITN